MRQLLLTICSLCCFFTFAQNFYPPIVNYSSKDYGKEKNPENYCVVQDHRGVMYFGNSHGVLEFDGEHWNFIQAGFGSFVRSLAVDERGVIYAGVYGDFGYLAPDSTGQLVFRSLLDRLPEEDQFFSNVWSIHTLSGKVYFQTEEALFIYAPDTDEIETIYAETSFHTSFLVDSTIYLRQREVGIVKLEGKKLHHLKGTEPFKGFGVFGMHQLEDDSLLIITQELGIYKWANDSIRLLPDENPVPLTELSIFGSELLSDGTLALNTFSNGVVIMNTSGKVVRKLDRTVGIRSDVVQYIYQDRDLNLWLALENGISKVNYHSPLSYFDEKTGIEGNVEAIIRFKEKLYVGTSYGLFAQDKSYYGAKRFRNTKLVSDQVWDFEIIAGQLYIGTAKGVFRTNDGYSFTQLTEETANVVLYRNQKNDFVVGGPTGIYIYNQYFREKWSYPTNFTTFLGGIVDPENEQVIWLGTSGSGMLRLTEQEGGDFALDQYGDFDGLLDGMGVPIVYEDKLIFGAKDGLFRFIDEAEMMADLADQLTEEEKADPAFTKGMFEPYVFKDSVFTGQFLLLNKGKERTWYCNEFKIGYYDHAAKQFKNRPFWGINYGRINEFYLEEDDVLWIGAGEGLIRYEKNNLKRYESHFYALIRQVSINHSDTIFNGVFVNEAQQFELHQKESEIPEIEYKKNDIAFLFSAPYFEDEHKPEYRYILEGSDLNWSVWTGDNNASYNNLHEGTYTFKVEARNVYGQVSEQTSYTFIILSPWYRTSWAYLLYAVLFLFILLLGVQISSKRLKAKNQWLEGVVEERTKEISQKNIILEHQKQEIEDSINYAQRIQEAILPLEEEMKKWIPKSFVLFRPKDIVSGDFYWFLERDKKLVFICADCTGHGVPGAFMSMIGSDRLNNIVSEKKITSPGAILSELNRAIKKSLKQDGQKHSTKDGMDAAICTIDIETGTLRYAGANRPLWIIENGALTEIKATKVAVAGHTPEDQVYQEHELTLKAGQKFYMTTDGYADQFGGERNKKYKVKNMKNFVCSIANDDFNTQKATLEKELLAWMGDYEQVDDVCVIGFEV